MHAVSRRSEAYKKEIPQREMAFWAKGAYVGLVLLLGMSCCAHGLRNEQAAALGNSMAFSTIPAMHHGGLLNKRARGMHMQQLPQDQSQSHSASADTLPRHSELAGHAGSSGKSAPQSSTEDPGPLKEDHSGGPMRESRRAAIGIGLGLVLGPMIPMLSTALTGEPTAHAATGAARPGDGDKKPFVQKSLKEVLQKAGSRALGGGRSGTHLPAPSLSRHLTLPSHAIFLIRTCVHTRRGSGRCPAGDLTDVASDNHELPVPLRG